MTTLANIWTTIKGMRALSPIYFWVGPIVTLIGLGGLSHGGLAYVNAFILGPLNIYLCYRLYVRQHLS